MPPFPEPAAAAAAFPMALAVIGGVTVSTLLTLFVVPAAYLSLLPLEKKGEIASKGARAVRWAKEKVFQKLGLFKV